MRARWKAAVRRYRMWLGTLILPGHLEPVNAGALLFAAETCGLLLGWLDRTGAYPHRRARRRLIRFIVTMEQFIIAAPQRDLERFTDAIARGVLVMPLRYGRRLKFRDAGHAAEVARRALEEVNDRHRKRIAGETVRHARARGRAMYDASTSGKAA